MKIDWISSEERKPDWSINEKIYVLIDDEIYTALPYDAREGNWFTIGWERCCYCGGQNQVVFEKDEVSSHERYARKWAVPNEEAG